MVHLYLNVGLSAVGRHGYLEATEEQLVKYLLRTCTLVRASVLCRLHSAQQCNGHLLWRGDCHV